MDGRTRFARAVVDLLAEAVEGLERGHAPAITLANGMRDALQAETSSYGWIDIPSQQGELRTWPDIPDVALMLQATGAVPRTHPVLGYWLDGYTDVAVVSSLVTDWSEWRNSEAYSLLKRGVGCTETGGIRLRDPHHTIRMIGVARARNFTPDEVQFIDDLNRPAVALCAHADWLRAVDEQGPSGTGVRQSAADAGLTTREFQVLQLLATGLAASSIAARLSISTRTVHRHLTNVYAKLGTHDRLTTVMVAQQSGLLLTETRVAHPPGPATASVSRPESR